MLEAASSGVAYRLPCVGKGAVGWRAMVTLAVSVTQELGSIGVPCRNTRRRTGAAATTARRRGSPLIGVAASVGVTGPRPASLSRCFRSHFVVTVRLLPCNPLVPIVSPLDVGDRITAVAAGAPGVVSWCV